MSARMECGICWWIYEPAEGDEIRQIDAGTDFGSLPEDWHCPRCDAPRAKFLPVDASDTDPVVSLRRAFEHVAEAKMRGLEIYNDALEVETVGFGACAGGRLGVLVTPWFMSAIYLPDDPAALAGAPTFQAALPAGDFRFEVSEVTGLGPVGTLGLLSPMDELADPAAARAIAEQVLEELRRAPPPPEVNDARRAFLTGAWS